MNSIFCFFFKQKTAYEIRPRDWSSDVCSSDLVVENCLRVASCLHDDPTSARRILPAAVSLVLMRIVGRDTPHRDAGGKDRIPFDFDRGMILIAGIPFRELRVRDLDELRAALAELCE